MTNENRPGLEADPSIHLYRESHYQADPPGVSAIESMHPRQKDELFSLASVILDDVINRVLSQKSIYTDNVMLFNVRNGDPVYSENPGNEYYHELSESELEASSDPIENINQGLDNAIVKQGEELIEQLANGRDKDIDPKIKKAFARLSMIAVRTRINISNLILEDSGITTLIGDMSDLSQELAEPFPKGPNDGFVDQKTKEDYLESARSSFPDLLERYNYDVLKVGVDNLKGLWDIYVNLTTRYVYRVDPFYSVITELLESNPL